MFWKCMECGQIAPRSDINQPPAPDQAFTGIMLAKFVRPRQGEADETIFMLKGADGELIEISESDLPVGAILLRVMRLGQRESKRWGPGAVICKWPCLKKLHLQCQSVAGAGLRVEDLPKDSRYAFAHNYYASTYYFRARDVATALSSVYRLLVIADRSEQPPVPS